MCWKKIIRIFSFSVGWVNINFSLLYYERLFSNAFFYTINLGAKAILARKNRCFGAPSRSEPKMEKCAHILTFGILSIYDWIKSKKPCFKGKFVWKTRFRLLKFHKKYILGLFFRFFSFLPYFFRGVVQYWLFLARGPTYDLFDPKIRFFRQF